MWLVGSTTLSKATTIPLSTKPATPNYADCPSKALREKIIKLMLKRDKSPSRPENRLLLAKAVSLFYLGYTSAEIGAKLGLSPSITYRYLRERSLLDPAKLDPRAQAARALKLLELEDQIARSMPGALAGELTQARAAIKAIKGRIHLLGFGLR
jgi:hypothetical protein